METTVSKNLEENLLCLNRSYVTGLKELGYFVPPQGTVILHLHNHAPTAKVMITDRLRHRDENALTD